MSATRSDAGRRLLPVLFWTGVALAPFAALALLLGRGGGPLRVAAVLAITSVVLMGLSVMLRQDVQSLRIHMEEALLDEVDVLRDDFRSELRQTVQGEVVAAMRAVQAAREREVAMLQARLEALQGQLEAPPTRRRALPAGSSTPVPDRHNGHTADRPAPGPVPSSPAPASPAPAWSTAHAENPPDVPRPRGGHSDTSFVGRHQAPQDAAPPPQPVRSRQAVAPGSAHATGTGHRHQTGAVEPYGQRPVDSGEPTNPRRRAQVDAIQDATPYREPRPAAHHAAPSADPWHDLRDEPTTHLGTRRREQPDPAPDRTADLGTRRDNPPTGRGGDNRYGHLRLVETGPSVGRRPEPPRPYEPAPADTRDQFWNDPLRAPIPLALPTADSAPTWSQLSNAPDTSTGRHSRP